MSSGNPPELTDEQLASFRGPMGGARMLSADEAQTLLTGYDNMVAFKRGIQAALDGESAADTHADGIRGLRRERDDLRAQLATAGLHVGRTAQEWAAIADERRFAGDATARELRAELDATIAPPLPTLGCQCRTCAYLRRKWDER